MWWLLGARILLSEVMVSRVTALRTLILVFTLVVVFLAQNNSSALTSYHHQPPTNTTTITAITATKERT